MKTTCVCGAPKIGRHILLCKPGWLNVPKDDQFRFLASIGAARQRIGRALEVAHMTEQREALQLRMGELNDTVAAARQAYVATLRPNQQSAISNQQSAI